MCSLQCGVLVVAVTDHRTDRTTLAKWERRNIDTLERRLRWLTKGRLGPTSDYIRAECSALRWALAHLNNLPTLRRRLQDEMIGVQESAEE